MESVLQFLGCTGGLTRRSQAGSIGPWSIAALVFFNVAGSPVGIEEAVVAGGPLWCILGLIIMPFVWSIPEALIAAELATAIPEDAGFVAWVSEAFGETMGYIEGFMSWAAGAVDLAAYPLLIVRYLGSIEGSPLGASSESNFTIEVYAIVLLLTAFNYAGLKIVGPLLVILTGCCLFPFALMVLLGAPEVQPTNWLQHRPPQDVQWGVLINTLFWNLNYFDSVSTVAAEVQNPAKTFPKAMFIAVPMIIGMYLLTVIVAVGVSPPGTEFDDTFFSNTANIIGGPVLQRLTVAAIVVSCVGQFEAELSENSFELLGMAERRMLPRHFTYRSSFGTPLLALGLNFGVTLLCLNLPDLNDVIELLNVLYIYAGILEFAAFLKLRFSRPDLARPFRAPVSNTMAVFMLTPTFVFTIFVLYLSSSWSQTVAAASLLCSVALAYGMQMLRSKYPSLFLPPSQGLGSLRNDNVVVVN